jgi:hypothetical protein
MMRQKMIPRLMASSAAWFAVVSLILSCRAAQIAFPSYQEMSEGLWKPGLLPGQRGFVFTMYGTPADLDGLRTLVGVMREQKLGNGFDPGPAARASSKPLFDYLATVGWPVMA